MAKRKKLHAKRGLSHEELRSDRFLESSVKLLMYVKERKERFIFGLIAVIALVSIGNRYLIRREKSDTRAEFQMTMAHQNLLNGDYENALFRYGKIVEQYGNSRQGKEAHYWIGEANFSLGRYDEAVEALEKFLSVSSRDDILSPSALGNLAASHEAMGDYARAAATYRRIYDEFRRSSLSGWACLNSGICSERAGEFEKAEEMYRIVIDEYGDAILAVEAKQNLAFLKGRLQARRLPQAE